LEIENQNYIIRYHLIDLEWYKFDLYLQYEKNTYNPYITF
jgi:hypothetical protein